MTNSILFFFIYLIHSLICDAAPPNKLQKLLDHYSPLNPKLYPSDPKFTSDLGDEAAKGMKKFIEENTAYFPVLPADMDPLQFLQESASDNTQRNVQESDIEGGQMIGRERTEEAPNKATEEKSGAVIWLRQEFDAKLLQRDDESIKERCKKPSLVVFFHGNRHSFFDRSQKSDLDSLFMTFKKSYSKLDFAYVEYPGTDVLQNANGWGRFGSPLTAVEASRASLRYLIQDQGFLPCEMIFIGHSMGSGIAVDLTHSLESIYRSTGDVRYKLNMMILLSPYTSLSGIVHKTAVAKWGRCFDPVGRAVSCLMVNNLDSLRKVPNIDVPTLYVHGQDDGFIPPSESLSLAAAQVKSGKNQAPVRVELISNLGHYDMLRQEQVQISIHEFIKKVNKDI